jgi:hypothetical protein
MSNSKKGLQSWRRDLQVFRSEIKDEDFVSCSFEQIKQDLDPAFSYIIFERPGPAGKAFLSVVFEALDRLNLTIHELKACHDRSAGKMLLVAKFDAGRTDPIMEEIFNAGLPMDVTFYGYGSSLSG